MTTYYHVYSESGFESWHRTASGAARAAERGAKRTKLAQRVYCADSQGVTGAGRGTLVAEVSS